MWQRQMKIYGISKKAIQTGKSIDTLIFTLRFMEYTIPTPNVPNLAAKLQCWVLESLVL